jgi:ribosome-associated heat shock protein Hsp15
MKSNDNSEKFRVDKWLWAARFFKTRSLASDAIDSGKVYLNGLRIKPAKQVLVGDMLKIRVGHYQYEVEVLALSNRRGSATVAQQLYRETDQSQQQRKTIAAQMKAQPQPFYTKGRPTKRDRREIERFKRKE